jgi:hypothetical protein
MGLLFTIVAGPRQRDHSWVRVQRDSYPNFTDWNSRLPQPGGPGPWIYIPQEQGDPVIPPPDTGFPFRRLLRLVGLRWKYSTPPPHGINCCLSLSLMLRPTVIRPVCLGIKHPPGANDQIFITVRLLRACWCGALSLTRGRICRLQLLLVLASILILGSESRETLDYILLSRILDFPLRHLLRLAGLRWKYLHNVHPVVCYSCINN